MGYLTGRDNTYLLSLINNDDATGTLADDARRELARRGALPDWAQAPAIDSPIADAPDSLESAASPISVEPIAGVRVNGVTVPPVMGADGRPLGDGQYYRVRDVKNAQAAAQEAQMSAEWDRQAKDDTAAYGTRQLYQYAYDPKTGGILRNADGTPRVDRISSQGVPGADNPLSDAEMDQQDNLAKRKAAESRQYQQNRALAKEPARAAYEDDVAARRERVRQVAQLAGGAQNVTSANRWILDSLLDMDPADRAATVRQMMPINPTRAQIESRLLDMSARLAGDAITGLMAGQFQDGRNEQLRASERLQALRTTAGAAYLSGWNKRSAVEEALISAGASPEERMLILSELFALEAGAAEEPPTAPQMGPEMPSDAQYYPWQAPKPAPNNPLAAPRPYG